jgi:hypothetical protein
MSSKNNTDTSTIGAMVGSDHKIFIDSSDAIIGFQEN